MEEKEQIERYAKIKEIVKLIKELPFEDRWIILRILNMDVESQNIKRFKLLIDKILEYFYPDVEFEEMRQVRENFEKASALSLIHI